MKSSIPFLLVIGMLFVGCDAVAPVAPEPSGDSLELMVTAMDNVASRSTSNVYTFDGMAEVGTSVLVRTSNGVSYNLKSGELEPGTVVTLWMVIFNSPENCVDGCGTDDLANPDAVVDVVYSSGRVIGGSGKASYAGHRSEGDDSGTILPAWLGLPSPGLVNAQEAEIHFIVHSHGPKIPILVDEMLHSFNAGCGPEFEVGLPPVPEELGTYGPNTCRDLQFAVHLP